MTRPADNLRVISITTVGPPTQGEWRTDQQILDVNGASWLCQAGGTPGTWTQLSGSGTIASLPTVDGLVGSTLADLTLVTGPNTTNYQVSNKLVTYACPVTAPATRIAFEVDAHGSGMISGQNYFGIYNAAGTLVMQTSDLTSTFGSGATHSAIVQTLPQTLPAGFYYVGSLQSYSTTQPYLVGVSYPMGPDIGANFGGTAPARVAYGSGTYTSLPGTINWSSAGFLSNQWNFVTWVGFLA